MTDDFDGAMRNRWTFTFAAADVLVGARKKRKHHESRVTWWQAQQKKIVAEVRRKGLEVQESVAQQYLATSAMNAPLRGKRIVVTDRYQEKLNECHTKIREHADKVRAYGGWALVLEGRIEKLSLTADDYLFFFGEA